MKENERTHFEEIRVRSLNYIRRLLPTIESLEGELNELREEYKDYKARYEEADKELAENDGRLVRVPTGRKGNKVKNLTIEQIKSVAKKLGVKI